MRNERLFFAFESLWKIDEFYLKTGSRFSTYSYFFFSQVLWKNIQNSVSENGWKCNCPRQSSYKKGNILVLH